MKRTKTDISITTPFFSDSIKLQFLVPLSWLKDVLMIESADGMIGIVFNITNSTTAAQIGSAGM